MSKYLLQSNVTLVNDVCRGMSGTQLLLTDGQGSFQQRLCFGVLPLFTIECRQIVEAARHFGMRGTQLLLSNGQSSHVQRFRFGVLPLILIEHSQIVEALGCVRMCGSYLQLSNGQG